MQPGLFSLCQTVRPGSLWPTPPRFRAPFDASSRSACGYPTELSVIVFDDNPWTELTSPPLSVIRQPIDMLAVHSLELVLGRMQGRLPPAPRTIEVKADFVPRSSCSPLTLSPIS